MKPGFETNGPAPAGGLNGGMRVGMLDLNAAARIAQGRAQAKNWWIIMTDFSGVDFLSEIEEAHYLGAPGLNADFELVTMPPLILIFANKRGMTPAQLAGILQKHGGPYTEQSLCERDIVCCGGDDAIREGWPLLVRLLTMPIRDLAMAA